MGVEEYRAPHCVTPIIVMSDSTKARLNPTNDDRHVSKSFSHLLAVYRYRAVGPPTGSATRGVGVVISAFFVCCVMIDQRVHVARCDAKEQIGFPQLFKAVYVPPIRLRDDADPKPLPLQGAADDGHAETRVINVGIPGNNNNVTAVPAKAIHFFSSGRQKRSGTEALCPVFSIVK